MDRIRYVQNAFSDYDDTELLTQDNQLATELRHKFILHICSLFRIWEGNFRFDSSDTSIYTGASGGTFLYLKLFEANLIKDDNLLHKLETISNSSLKHMKHNRFAFLCGSIGVLTVKCLVNSLLEKEYNSYLVEIAKIINKVCNEVEIPDEILYGRSGILFALLFIRSKLLDSTEVITDKLLQNLVNSILNSGEKVAKQEKSKTPLMFYWHQKGYVGAAHGYAGILYMLLEARNYMTSEQLNKQIKPTIDFVLDLQFEHSGNFPSSLNNTEDKLLHWCHGSPGVIHLLILAYQVFGDDKYLNSALKSADDIWNRGLLNKGFGLCHGVSGNGYAFLRIFQQTNNQKYLYRAIKFAEWCCDQGKLHVSRIPDRPYSLFEGSAGTIYYLIDLLNPKNAKFPAFQL